MTSNYNIKRYLLVILLLLTACQPASGDRQLHNYSTRLARVLEIPLPALTIPAPVPLPAIRDLQHILPDISLTLTQAYSTRHCALDQLIAERNSSLGRVFRPSQQLHYELRLLYQLEQCQHYPWENKELAQLLADSYQLKQLNIVPALHNMLLTDDTLRQQLTGQQQLLSPAAGGLPETYQALNQLIQLRQLITAQNWQQAAELNPEEALATLYRTQFIAKLQYSLRYSLQWLTSLNLALENADISKICPTQRSNQTTDILANVLRLYFIGEVQGYLAELLHYQHQLVPVLQQLYLGTPLEQHIYQRFVLPAEQLQQQTRQHVRWWQQLSSYCNTPLTG